MVVLRFAGALPPATCGALGGRDDLQGRLRACARLHQLELFLSPAARRVTGGVTAGPPAVS